MLVVYDPELTEQVFYENVTVLQDLGVISHGARAAHPVIRLGTIENPIVGLDRVGLGKLENGELIGNLFNVPQIPLVTSYDDTASAWHHLEGTWPTTIDTVVHLSGQQHSTALQTATRIHDVACGGGMAGGYAVNQNGGIEFVHFSDIALNSLETTRMNQEHMKRTPDTVRYTVADGLAGAEDNLDVIIASAIPSTPVVPGLEREINPLFEGTALIESILRDAPEHLGKDGRLLLSHSSVGDKAFDEMAARYGATVEDTLAERDVAFRVEFLGDQRWVDFLVEQGGLRKDDKRGYPYWHTVKVKEISY